MSSADRPPDTAPARRRNGKPPACEPCRKSRLRCNHARPACARCTRRGETDKCIYHPAPMTRQYAIQSQPSSDRHSSTPVSPVTPKPRPIPTPSASTEVSTPPSPSSTPALGFLGSTSFSAVFTEQKANLDIGLAAHQQRNTMVHPPAQVRTNQDQDLVRAGAKLLSMFRYTALMKRFIEHWYVYAHGLPILAPVVWAAFDSIETMYGEVLQSTDNDTQLLVLSEEIFNNTSKPLRVSPYTSALEYASFFIGDNLRWEIVGIIITLVGASATITIASSEPIWDEVERLHLGRKQFASEIVEMSNVSLSLVKSDGEANDLLAWLLYDNFMLLTVHHGDSSAIAWGRLGELAGAVFAMGLHQPIPQETANSVFLAEARKIFFATVYVADKELGTFLGRPPRISRRYCACQLPLDLSEEELQMENGALHEALSRLDDTGWNSQGSVRRCGYIRIRMLNSFIREDILEISLGMNVENLEQRAQDISNRSRNFQSRLPSWFQYSSRIMEYGKPSLEYVISAIIHLDFLYSDFLIARTLIRRTGQTSSGFLDIFSLSDQILTTVLSLAAERDRLAAFQTDIAWEIAYYGLPAAGVLAVELLRQHYEQEERFPDTTSSPSFSRSETIQNLSVFISCLEWVVRLGIGNHSACNEAKGILKRILDRILLPPPKLHKPARPWTPVSSTFADARALEPRSQSVGATAAAGGPLMNTLPNPAANDFEPHGDVDFMSWLDNMDIDMGNWINFNALWDSTGLVNG